MDTDIEHDITSGENMKWIERERARHCNCLIAVHDGDYWRLLTPGEYEVTVGAVGFEPQSKLVEVRTKIT